MRRLVITRLHLLRLDCKTNKSTTIQSNNIKANTKTTTKAKTKTGTNTNVKTNTNSKTKTMTD